MPSTNGTMGAFWLNAVDGGWPPEIDIVEALGKSPTMLSVTLHTSDQSAQINKLVPVADMSKGFHTYAVDWNANTITVYFDGNQVFQNATPSDMHKPMYILLDSAVGTCGSWEGCPSGDILDAMTVASVEVWTSNPHLPPPTVVAQASPSVSQPNQSTQQPGEQSVQATVDAQIQASQQQMQADETAAQAEIAAAQAAPDPNAALIKQGDDLAAKADAILNGVLADMGGGN
jgi:beta-glucanase (GH16 family)